MLPRHTHDAEGKSRAALQKLAGEHELVLDPGHLRHFAPGLREARQLQTSLSRS